MDVEIGPTDNDAIYENPGLNSSGPRDVHIEGYREIMSVTGTCGLNIPSCTADDYSSPTVAQLELHNMVGLKVGQTDEEAPSN